MDVEADLGDFSEQQWRIRFTIEKELMDIYATEEIYWQKRGGVKWLLEGDSNTAFSIKVQMAEKGSRLSTLWKMRESVFQGRQS